MRVRYSIVVDVVSVLLICSAASGYATESMRLARSHRTTYYFLLPLWVSLSFRIITRLIMAFQVQFSGVMKKQNQSFG